MIGLPKKIFLPDVCFAMPRFSLCHRYLNAFLVCAHEKSFSKAARLLYVSPTALIKQIEQLEEGIGTTLFERTPRGLVLTRSGSVLQSKAQNFVQHGDALLADVPLRIVVISTSALRTCFPGDTSSSCGIGYKNDSQRQHPEFD